MPYRDPDNANPQLTEQIAALYERSAERLRKIVLNPPGRTAASQEFRQARASALLSQVQTEIDALKKQAASWTGTSLQEAMTRGQQIADQQATAAGVRIPKHIPKGSFHQVNRQTVEVLARDITGDLFKAADSMGNTAKHALRKMAATGVTTAQVNTILAGGVIEGQPVQAARELKAELEKVHGDKVTITDKNGDPITFDTGYYARLVAVTKTREASRIARHQRLQAIDLDLVMIIGLVSKNFCTAYLGKVFSISGKDKTYPPYSSLPGTGAPFHPQCSKSDRPFIPELASNASTKAAQPDDRTDAFLGENDTTLLQRQWRESHLEGVVEARQKSLVEDIRSRARANGYTPPPHGSAE